MKVVCPALPAARQLECRLGRGELATLQQAHGHERVGRRQRRLPAVARGVEHHLGVGGSLRQAPAAEVDPGAQVRGGGERLGVAQAARIGEGLVDRRLDGIELVGDDQRNRRQRQRAHRAGAPGVQRPPEERGPAEPPCVVDRPAGHRRRQRSVPEL